MKNKWIQYIAMISFCFLIPEGYSSRISGVIQAPETFTVALENHREDRPMIVESAPVKKKEKKIALLKWIDKSKKSDVRFRDLLQKEDQKKISKEAASNFDF